MADVKRQNVTPLLGIFGIGGPYSASFSELGGGSDTALFFFKRVLNPLATAVCTIISEDLPIKALQPTFVDPSGLSKEMRFVIEQSGLDLQLFVIHTTAEQ